MRVGLVYIIPEKKLTGINKLIKGTVSEVLKLDKANQYYSIDNNYLKLSIGKSDEHSVKLNLSGQTLGPFQLADEETKMFDMRCHLNQIDLLHSYFRPFCTLNYSCPKILTIYDLIPSVHPEWALGKEFYDGPLRKSAEEADKIIAISEYTKQDIIQYYKIPEEKITVIYPGIESKLDFENANKALLNESLFEDGYLLSVCSLAPHKNIGGIIEGFIAFKKQFKNSKIKLILVGQFIPGHDILKYASDMDIFIKDVVITDYVTDEKLAALYKFALGVIYVSFYEGFGLPILEAMSAGKAVITSNITSMPEVGGDAVIYCNPYAKESIANAITILVMDKVKREECEQKGIVQAQKFSYKKAAKETLQLYQELE